MPAIRVHELAKEFGMSSKELLEHLERLKIPAKGHSSTLHDAYVQKIRKDLAPIIAERQAAMEAERAKQEAEEAARKAAEEEAARKAAEEEAARKAAEEEAARKAAEEEAKRHAAARVAKAATERALEPEERPEPARISAVDKARAKAKSEAEERLRRIEEERKRLEAEARAAEERKRLEEEAARLEAEEAERYRKMAREAEEAERHARLLAEAARLAATGTGGTKKKKKAKKAADKETPSAAQPTQPAKPAVAVNEIAIPEGATVGEFAEAVGLSTTEIIKRLMMLGELLTVNQPIGRTTMEILAEDLGISIKVLSPEEEAGIVYEDRPEDLKPRPPVVTVMGHVDHGKTSLLDAIRETGVAATEAGGITQHIGASVVHHNGKQITFIDTPGHEAFTAMRARGAKVTDVAVLVVAADDGVMPQTVEAINHAKAAGVPIIVAVNKIDKDGANPDRVRQELTEHGIIPEEWGGSNIFVDVSAKKRINIDELLEMILLQAEVLELKANPDAPAHGVVIEAKLDRGRGPVATVLVQRGTLRVGDAVVAGTSHGRVRALVDPKGNQVETARPADPVEILGLSSVPAAGDEFRVVADDREARRIAEERALKQRLLAEQRKTHVSLDDLFARIAEGELKELNLVVKADVQGSIEALKDALDKMDQSEVRINVIHSGVGGITESDVMLADASDAIIIGFNVRPEPKAKALAEQEKVDLRLYRVIYQAIEDINAARVGLLAPTIEERDTGRAEVRELFRIPKVGVVAGCVVTEGEINADDQVRVVRNGAVIHEGTIRSLRHFKEDVTSVRAGSECGIAIDGFQDIKEGDYIEGFKTVEVARKE
ncbi:translation initiation factor IF-2 [Coriobacteriia bacterium Es71-Z0120]|uniref:translation initiation factor IF-2 n=1 Tax=Parvivirga hydrogeniphila TaxID=2939460 RepID=UPI0022608400|nr:translation initiation factor IF-2 [Parvivirga hydrogeniphila]MCL4079600.1 translation initiation factor IF-2 [Parvivirga hydrogeniphila]